MEVKTASSDEELKMICPVMLELRPQYDEESLVRQIKQQFEDGYQIAYVEDNGNVLCVAGFVIGEKLAWEKHIYIDDLVTSEVHRSTGAGKFIIDWFKKFGRENGCKQLHLDSAVHRFAAHKFYLREGFCINSHHFAIADLHAD